MRILGILVIILLLQGCMKHDTTIHGVSIRYTTQDISPHRSYVMGTATLYPWGCYVVINKAILNNTHQLVYIVAHEVGHCLGFESEYMAHRYAYTFIEKCGYDLVALRFIPGRSDCSPPRPKEVTF